MELTDTQRKVLRGLRLGDELAKGHYSGKFYLDGEGCVRPQTVESLERRGLIKALPYRAGNFKTVYVLTDKGRATIG